MGIAATTPPEPIEMLVSDIAPEEVNQTIPEEFYEEPIDQADPNNLAFENFIAELFENSGSRSAVPMDEPAPELEVSPERSISSRYPGASPPKYNRYEHSPRRDVYAIHDGSITNTPRASSWTFPQFISYGSPVAQFRTAVNIL
jgi:hypothetical protein